MQITEAEVDDMIARGAVPMGVARLLVESAVYSPMPGNPDWLAAKVSDDTGLTVPYALKLVYAVLDARET